MDTGIKEAKNSLSKLVGAVLAGEDVFLTNRGVRVAQIVPVRKAGSPMRARGLFKDKINLYPGWDSAEEDLKIERMFETNPNG